MQFSLKCSNAAVSVLVRSGFTAKSRGDVAQDSADVLPERDEGGEAAAHGVPGHFLYQFLVVIQAVVTCRGALQVSIVALRKED